MDKHTAGIVQTLSDLVIYNELKLRAIDDIFVEKGLLTREEIDEKFKVVHDEKFTKLRDELLNSFKENSKNY